jgi:hypothetical protein
MKADQTGDAMGRAIWRSSFSGDPGANFFYGKRRRGTRPEDLPYEEDAVRSFLFCFSSLAERGFAAARSGQGRAAFWRGGSAPLTARTAAKESAREEKTCSQGRKISITTETAMTNKNTSNPNPGLTSKMPKLSEGQLEPLFRRLNLAHTRRIYQEVADRAEKENWSYRDFLALLLAEEVAHRKQTRLQRARLILPSSRPLMSSILVCGPPCVSPSSVPTWDRISSPKGAR